MTNREKYAEQIKNYEGTDFCKDFVRHIIFKNKDCYGNSCQACRLQQALWLDEKYIAPEKDVDWSKVEEDARISVSDDNIHWYRMHFAKYQWGTVWSWCDGMTSWSGYRFESKPWKYAKLEEAY